MLCIVLLFILLRSVSAAQGERLSEIERSHDAVILVADAQSGSIVAYAHRQQADSRSAPPGSVFKLAIALAVIRSNRFDAAHRYTCTGRDTIAGHAVTCWRPTGHGSVGLERAIANSCNLYFRQIAQRLTSSEILSAARALSLMPMLATTIDPDKLLTEQTILGDAWRVTPTQMLSVAMSLASRGKRSPGHLLLFSPRYTPLYRGMRDCVRNGTGRDAWSRRLNMAGKTGTVERADGMPGTHGWFIGFAPAERPRYVVVVLLSGARGGDAAVLARRALEQVWR